MEEKVPCGTKVVAVTWKEKDLWILTRPMEKEEEARNLVFQESSSWGILNGTIKINECKK